MLYQLEVYDSQVTNKGTVKNAREEELQENFIRCSVVLYNFHMG